MRDAELIRARVEAFEPGARMLSGTRVLAADQSHKSGSPLEVQFGLGRQEVVDLKATFPSGKVTTVSNVAADCHLELDAQKGRTRPVDAGH